MIDTHAYMDELTRCLLAHFGARLVYVGLQGSRRRGEAKENSDVDVMAVLDRLDIRDMDDYRAIVAGVSSEVPSCGFICGVSELKNWNALELCQLTHETLDVYGTLADLVPSYTPDDVRAYVKYNVAAGYHMLCHEYIHSTREACEQALLFCFRSAFPMMCSVFWLQNGVYPQTKSELLERLSGADREILSRSCQLKDGGALHFESDYLMMFTWCQTLLQTL
ncbi:MAG: nucleotidyltransferase domain-containing protein [Pyramidobacter sp.]|nr:nucleotidyltransferase domain-containing protein [Pyramidobacter sp.]